MKARKIVRKAKGLFGIGVRERLAQGVTKKAVSPARIVVEREGKMAVVKGFGVKVFWRMHEMALAEGRIRCENYGLKPYEIEIMNEKTRAKYYPSPPLETMELFLRGGTPIKPKSRQKRKDFANAQRIFRESGLSVEGFSGKLAQAHAELTQNIKEIYSSTLGEAVYSRCMAIVRAYDRQSGKIVFTVIGLH